MTEPRTSDRPRALDPLHPGSVLAGAAVATLAGVVWQTWLGHVVTSGAAHGAPAAHALTVAVDALPPALLAAALLRLVARRVVGGSPVAVASLLGLAAAVVLAVAGGASGGAAGVFADAAVVLPVTVAAALAVAAAARVSRTRWSGRRVVAQIATVALLGSLPALSPSTASAAPTVNGPCPAGARDISYDLAAFQQAIPLNGWGDELKDGLQYALKNSGARGGKADIVANPNLSAPIVIRANVGDCITVKLRNDISNRTVGIHPDGLVQFDPATSDGAAVGRNPDTTVAPGAERTYTWYADRVGEAPVLDVANLDGESTVQYGLYGGLIVHPQGSVWSDPVTGLPLLGAGGVAVQSALFADVQTPTSSFRSFAMVFMDENEDIVDRNGAHPTFPGTTNEDSTFGINYRSEPLRNRLRALHQYRAGRAITLPSGRVFDPAKVDDPDPAVAAANRFCDGYVPELGKVVADPGAKCMGEESYLQSWVFGDEGKLNRKLADGRVVTDSDNLIPKAYVGDRVRFHVIHPGASETHPWHQHTQRWRTDPDSATASETPLKDVQSVSPGEAFPLELEGGAGGTQRTVGDAIFHCHLYPHFAQGFWGHLRVFDRLRDGTQSYADGTPIQALKPLAGNTPPAPTATNPGFPLFVKGDVGQRAYRMPNAVVRDDFAAIRRPGDTKRAPTALESANLRALDPAKPGVGWTDPCPSTAPVRTYRPHVIDTPIVYNRAKWKDKQGRIYVEESHADLNRDGRVDKADLDSFRSQVDAGTRQVEPYTVRAQQGECVQVLTTNDLHLDEDPTKPLDRVNRLDGTYMTPEETSEVSAHVHLVKFDQLGSDGTSVGWNYVQAAMPGQTYGSRWFVDTALRTVFFHDHQYANLHQQKGLFAALNIEPKGSTWHDPKTGHALPQGVGTVADVRVPDGPDFREFTVFHQDRAPMWRNGGSGPAVEPPGTPDDFGADQGGYAFNYRNEPFQIRTSTSSTGLKADPAYIQSSVVHGDPSTPLFRAYPKDPVIVRNVVASHEEVHTFNLHGHRWLSEPDNLHSTLVDNQTLSLAEYFNYEVEQGTVTRKPTGSRGTLKKASAGDENGVPDLLEGGAGEPGDYLYGSTPLDDQWLGLWGIFRVPAAKVSDLQTLDNPTTPSSSGSPWPAIAPGGKYPKSSPKTVDECPSDAPRRPYDITAIQMGITYNGKSGEHDPNGALFVLTGDVTAVRNGTKPAEPLTIRANAGDCLQITLRNGLPTGGIPAHSGDVPLPADAPFPKSARVSLHPSLVFYDITRSDGAAVGYNYDSTVAPGKSINYSWYVSPRLVGSTINLVDLADRRGHRHHGLFGGLVVEPTGSTWTDPVTGAPVVNGLTANINWTDANGVAQAYREHTVHWQDGLNLRLPNGSAVPTAGEVDDPYDTGNRGINFRTERFAPRLAKNGALSKVFSSAVHGDPATPVMQAYAGERIRLRLLQGSDRGRTQSVVVSGHSWNYLPADGDSRKVSAQGRLLTTEAHTLELVAGARRPGAPGFGGDYLVRSASTTNQVNAGLWGLLRVHTARQTNLRPLQ